MPRFDRAFLDQLLQRTSILDIVGRKVTWDRKKSNQGKGDFWACCPFHSEDTPSFHAEERKGSYYCFGCGAKGNAIDFTMAMENLSFPEAVEKLANEAGMALPSRDAQAEKRQEQWERLLAVLDAARGCFEQALRSSEGEQARAYFERRGLGEENWRRFGLGFAPNQRDWLIKRLTQAGHTIADVLASGVANQPDDGRAPFDRFRGRVMFSIEDGRGRTISFGARTLDPDGQPKYLNGPETQVFDKGRTLYRYKEARAAARNQPILIAEGYMDVIALELAGFAAVAPLGTAVTEDQLQLAWRAHTVPVLCLDGDVAGVRAAERALERALPLINSERSLRFCTIPDGQDPDDVIKAGGPDAMQKLVQTARPLSGFLLDRAIAVEPLTTPEARARCKKALRSKLEQITDRDLQTEMVRDLLRKIDMVGRPNGPQPKAATNRRSWRGRDDVEARPTAELESRSGHALISRALIALVSAPISQPEFLEEGAERLGRLDIDHPALDSLRHALLDRHFSGESLDFEGLRGHLAKSGNDAGASLVRSLQDEPENPYTRPDRSPEERQRHWLEALERYQTEQARVAEMVVLQDQASSGDLSALQKLAELRRQAIPRTAD